jgi:hypothetical protein
MKVWWQGSEKLVAQHPMGRGCVEAAIQSVKPATTASEDGSSSWMPPEDLASKYPIAGWMRREQKAMKRSQR